MARFDDPNSAESSFSFVLGNAPNLDGKYTVFGEVIQNMQVLDEIEKLPPKTVYIESAEVVARKDLANATLAPAHPPRAALNLQLCLFIVLALGVTVFFLKNMWEVVKS